MRQTITLETGRFTIRNPLAAARRRSAEHPMALFAALAGAAMMFFAVAPQASALAADDQAPVTMASADAPACSGQTWGRESEACLVALAAKAEQPRAKIRIIDLQ